MRVNVNLATRPFEDARDFLHYWVRGLAVLLAITAGLVWYAMHSYRRARTLNGEISAVQKQIRQAELEESQARALLLRPENKGTVERSEFLNAVFARKAFSWTTVFSEMEKIMPYGLYVVSIRPILATNNELHVSIVVAGNSRERAGELVRSMEKVSRFKDVTLISETLPNPEARSQDPKSSQVQYTITALYQPQISGTPAEETAAPVKQNTGGSATGRQTVSLERKR